MKSKIKKLNLLNLKKKREGIGYKFVDNKLVTLGTNTVGWSFKHTKGYRKSLASV